MHSQLTISFHNTNGSKGADLTHNESRAQALESRVLDVFYRHPNRLMAAHEIYEEIEDTSIPLTSVRRAVTNLTTRSYLEKTDKKVMGPYGKYVYMWALLP